MSTTIQIDPMLLLEARLTQKLEEKIREGWKIDPETGFDPKNCVCCLLGAQINEMEWENHGYFGAAMWTLNIDAGRSSSLESGFRGQRYVFGYPEYHALGAKLRKQYVK